MAAKLQTQLVLVLVQETRVLLPQQEIEIGYGSLPYQTPISHNSV